MRISAVVVNYNSGSYLRECIDGLMRYLDIGKKADEVVVVDNHSTDRSLDLIMLLPGIRVIRSGTNFGYGGGCNVGFEHTDGEILLFMNADATLISPVGCVRDAFEQDNTCAVVAPRIVEPDGRLYETFGRLPTVGSDALCEMSQNGWFRRKNWSSPFINTAQRPRCFFGHFTSGSAFFIRREVFEEVGKFDAGFFLYYEEADLFKRLSDCGYRFIYEAGCAVRHISGGSSGSLGWKRTALRYNSKLRYFSKHSQRGGLRVHKAVTLLILFLKVVLYLLGRILHCVRPGKLHAYAYAIRLYMRGYIPWCLTECDANKRG